MINTIIANAIFRNVLINLIFTYLLVFKSFNCNKVYETLKLYGIKLFWNDLKAKA